MNISPEALSSEAAATGFRVDVIEKVAHLLGLLNALQQHPFLKGKLILKGGTALNLFVFDAPRLSIDIDLNYTGTESREDMLAERPKIEQATQAVFMREGFTVRRMPEQHAGGKWLLRYQSALGQMGNLEVDINFMYRVPLWPSTTTNSCRMGTWQATDIPVLELHELAAGKLAALLSRMQARDLFDSYRILHREDLDRQRMRIAFVVYGAMNRKDWRTVSIEDVDIDDTELKRQLVPVLHRDAIPEAVGSEEYGKNLVEGCRKALSAVLPFTEAERDFLDLLLEKGEVEPTLLTTDKTLQDRIQRQPLLKWKSVNVRRHRGLA